MSSSEWAEFNTLLVTMEASLSTIISISYSKWEWKVQEMVTGLWELRNRYIYKIATTKIILTMFFVLVQPCVTIFSQQLVFAECSIHQTTDKWCSQILTCRVNTALTNGRSWYIQHDFHSCNNDQPSQLYANFHQRLGSVKCSSHKTITSVITNWNGQ